MQIDGHQLDSFLMVILEKTGIDLKGYCKATLLRRISQRLKRLNMDADQYLTVCHDVQNECQELINSIVINFSSFFRNPSVFEAIAQSILPRLLTKNTDEIRVWSAGCAAGEEAYSTAILIREELKRHKTNGLQSTIFATDIDRNILKQAKRAFYPRKSLLDTKLGIVDTYFSPKESGFQLCSKIRSMVHFSVDDLLSQKTVAPSESVYGSFDIVLCRNILIYFSDKHQKQVIQKLYQSLAKGGYLILGDSETLFPDFKSQFRTFDAKNKIYQK